VIVSLALRRRARHLFRSRHLRIRWLRAVLYLRARSDKGWVLDDRSFPRPRAYLR
jgi:hypothetical protein